MSVQPIRISEFRSAHGLSNRAFSRMREKAQIRHPGVQLTELHHRRVHNNNVILRPDLFEDFLPLEDLSDGDRPTAEEVNLNDLYARISKLEADALSQKKSRNRPVTKRRSELSRVFESEV